MVRFIMIGGFLGAGKTTTIARLAQHYRRQGRNVAVVTNDQATELVDTFALRSEGFDVGEVAGACFCCHFDELTRVVERLGETARPEVVLAEPVGSCTDLVATVIRPLRRFYRDRFAIAPYGVILKPSHGRRILKNEPRSGFSPQAAYIFRKQLEEADFVIINRIDELRPEQVDELAGLIAAHYPGMPTIRMSAKTGDGFASLLSALEQPGESGRRVVELDYDRYAQGEAELGWLNATVRVTAQTPFSLDALLLAIIDALRQSLAALRAETAHVKAIGMAQGRYAVANLVSGDGRAELSRPSEKRAATADVVVNARVAVDPGELERHVRGSVDGASRAIGARAEIARIQSFRPARPVPTHRFTAAAGQ